MECNNTRAEGKKIPTDSLEQKVQVAKYIFQGPSVAFLRIFCA